MNTKKVSFHRWLYSLLPIFFLLFSFSAQAQLGNITIADPAMVAEADGTVTFTISWDNPAGAGASFDLAYSGSFNDGTDFVGIAILPIAQTATTVDLVLTWSDDLIVELDETLTVTITGITLETGTILDGVASALVTNDDGSEVSINTGLSTTSEGGGIIFTISMTNPSDQPVSVRFNTSNGTALTGDNDYNQVSNQLVTINAGSTSATVSVTTNDDNKVEANETFTGTISNILNSARAVSLSTSLTGTATINNDDDAVVSVAGASISEGASGDSPALNFIVSMTNPSDVATSVTFNTSDVTTLAGTDYTAVSGTVTIPIGSLSQTATVTITGDDIVEFTETFTGTISALVTNSRPTVTLGTSSATGTITNDDSSVISIASDASATEGSGVQFTVSMTKASDADAVVTFVTTDGVGQTGATTADSDYTGLTGTNLVTIVAGQTSATTNALVATGNDTKFEGDETFTVTIAEEAINGFNGRGISLGTVTRTGTINNNDPAPLVTLSGNATITEDPAGTPVYNVVATLSNASGLDVTVTVGITNTTSENADYTLSATDIVIPAGSLSAFVTVTAVDDNIDDNAETFRIDIVNVVNGTESGSQQATITITDNDPAPSVTISPASATEGSAISMLVTLSNPSGADITLNFQATSGTAIVGTDLSGTIASLTFTEAEMAGGTLSKNISISTTDDSIDEPSESFTVSISSVSGTISSSGTGLGTINDNDSAPVITVADAGGTEGGPVTFVVTLSNASSTNIILDFATSGGTAISGTDFTAAPNLTSFTFTAANMAAGTLTQSVVVTTLEDNIDEVTNAPETFSFIVTANASNTTALGTIDSGGTTGSITDNDASPTVVVTAGAAAAEGTSQSYTVALSHPSDAAIVLNYTTVADGTAAGTDFTTTSGTWNFPALSTTPTEGAITVAHTSDNIDEGADDAGGAETYSFNATYSSGGAVGTITNASGSIIDNDVAPAIAISSPSATEGSTADFVFSITNGQVSQEAITITVNTGLDAGVSAAESNDFTAVTNGTVTFDPFQSTSETFNVSTTDDIIDEVGNSAAETFLLSAVQASGYTLTSLDASATGTINDVDVTPTLTISDPAGSETSQAVVFALSLSHPSSDDIVVNLSTSAGTATGGGVDFNDAPNFTSVTFTGDEVSPNTTPDEGTVTVTVIDDTIYEPGAAETLTLSASLSSGTVSISDTGAGTIADNDPAPVATISNASATEGSQLSFTVSLDREANVPVSVQVSTVDGTAVDLGTANGENDYTGISGQTVTFPANNTSQVVLVSTTNDAVYEGPVTTSSENLFLEITSVDANVTGLSNTGTGTIINNDIPPAVLLVVTDNGVNEDSETAGVFIQLIGNLTALPAVAAITVTSSVAIAGTDFNVDLGNNTFNLTVPVGPTTSNTATFTPIPDIIYEGQFVETVTFAVTGVTDCTENSAQLEVITIIDAESPPTVTITSEQEDEGDDLTFTVHLGDNTSDIVSANIIKLDISTASGTATKGVDFIGNTTTITLPALTHSGTYTVTNTDDAVYELGGTETFTVSAVKNGTSVGNIGATSTGTGTINDMDNQPVVELSVDNASIAENGGIATVTATLTGATTSVQAVTVDFTFGGTTGGSDFSSGSQIAIPAGSSSGTLLITGLDDNIFESPNETIIVDMTVTNGTEGMVNQLTITVIDDEDAPEISIAFDAASIDEGGSVGITATIDNGVVNSRDMVIDLEFGAATGNNTFNFLDNDLDTYPSTVTIPANSSSGTETVYGYDDSYDEFDEDVQMDATGYSNGGVAGSSTSSVVTLVDNDDEPTVTLGYDNGIIVEYLFDDDLYAELSSQSEKDVTVNLGFLDSFNSAYSADPEDYSADTQIVISAGTNNEFITVFAEVDGVYEPGSGELLGVEITSIVNGIDGSSVEELDVYEDGTAPSVVIGNAPTVTEGGDLVYTVTLVDEGSGNQVDQDVTIEFNLGGGTDANFILGADNGTNDYNTDLDLPATIVISSFNSSGDLSVPTFDDNLWEDQEYLEVIIVDAYSMSATYSYSGTGEGYVDDNDTAPTITLRADDSINENDPNYTVYADMSGPAGRNFSIAFALNGTAQGSGVDFTTSMIPATITTVSGATTSTITFEIDPINDDLDENDETIIVGLSSSDITVLDNSQTIILTDAADDLPPVVTISLDLPGTEMEDVSRVITATLDAVSGKDITIDFAVNGGSAVDGDDYILPSSIFIAAGSLTGTSDLDVIDDDLWEGGSGTTEDAIIDVTVNPTSVGTLAPGSDQFTIDIEDNEVTPAIRLSVDKSSILEDGSFANGVSTLTYSLVNPNYPTDPSAWTSIVDIEFTLLITGDATDVDDYTIAGATWDQGTYTVTIPAGNSSSQITVTSIADNLYEGGDESAFIDIDNSTTPPVNAVILGGGQNVGIAITEGDADPVITIADASADEDTGTMTFTITSTPPSDEDIDIIVSMMDGTAISSGTLPGNPDYNSTDVVVTLIGGNATVTADVPLNTDNVFETDEIFTVSMAQSGTTSYDLAIDMTDDATGTILNDDSRPTVTLTGDATIAEDGSLNPITATLSALSTETVTVNLGVATSSTAEGTDYGTSSLTITILSGAMSGTMNVGSAADNIDEIDETVVIEIVSVTNGTENGTQEVTTTITDDDNAPLVSISDASSDETSAITFNVSLSNPSDEDITVNVSTAVTGVGSGNAISDTDYMSLASQTVTIAAGSLSNTVDVTLTDDNIDEVDETFTLLISSVGGGITVPGPGVDTDLSDTGTGTISDDNINDDTPLFSFDQPSYTITEDDTMIGGSVLITFSLSNPSSEDIYIPLGTFEDGYVPMSTFGIGSAVEDEDYNYDYITVTVPAGSLSGSLTVSAILDDIDEFDETFIVAIADEPTGGVPNPSLPFPTSVWFASFPDMDDIFREITILDNDNAPTLTFDDTSVSELEDNGTISFPFTLSNPSSGDITISFAVTGTNTVEDIAEASDYNAMVATVVVAAGATSGTAVVTINDDSIDEFDEEFTLTVTGGVVDMNGPNDLDNSTPASVLGIILDDDALPAVLLSVTADELIESIEESLDVYLTLLGTTEKDVIIDLGFNNGIPAAMGIADMDDDYITTGTQITIPAGSPNTVFQLSAVNEAPALDEINETIFMEILSVTNGTESGGVQDEIITILDDDFPSIVSLSSDATVLEGSAGAGNQAVITASLNLVSAKDISIDVQVAAGSVALDGTDFGIDFVTINIPAGSFSATTTITTVGDNFDELDEDAILEIASGVNSGNDEFTSDVNIADGTLSTTTSILDDDLPPVASLSVDLTSTNEASAATITYTVTLTADPAPNSSARSNLDLVIDITPSGTATLQSAEMLQGNPGDYTDPTTFIDFSAIEMAGGTFQKTFTVGVLNENVYEVAIETIGMAIAGADVNYPGDVTIGTATVNTDILSDDPLPNVTVSQDFTIIPEMGGVGTISVDMDRYSQLDMDIDFLVSGTANDPLDYSISGLAMTIVSGSLSETAPIVITSNDDLIDEDDFESVILTVNNTVNGTLVGANVITTDIEDDEISPVATLTVDVLEINEEDGVATITATLDKISGLPITVNLLGNGLLGLAIEDIDYNIGGALTTVDNAILIPAGSLSGTITLNSIQDFDTGESDETAQVYIASVTNGTIGVQDEVAVVIIEDKFAPSGFVVSFVTDPIDPTNEASVSFQIADGEVGATYTYTISDGVTTPINGIGAAPISGTPEVISGIDLSSFQAGTITVTVKLTDIYGNESDPLNPDAFTTPIATVQKSDGPDVTLSTDLLIINEENGVAVITATLGQTIALPVTVNLTLAGTATEGADYDLGAGGNADNFITIPANTLSASITLTSIMIDPLNIEGDETVQVSIGSLVNGTLSTPNQVTVLILEDRIAPANFQVSWITNPIDPSNESSVSFQIANGEIGASYTYTITDGVNPEVTGGASIAGTPEVISGLNLADLLAGNVTVTVRLTDKYGNVSDPNIIVGSTVPTATVQKSDGPNVSLSVNLATIFEDGGVATITATLDAAIAVPVTVNLQGVGPQPLALIDDDYLLSSTQIIIPANSLTGSITLTAKADEVEEGDETAQVEIASLVNGTLGSQSSVEILLIEDNVPPAGFVVKFVNEIVTVLNQSNISFTIEGGEENATFIYTISDGILDVIGSGTITDPDLQTITNVDLSGLAAGTLTLTVILTDDYNNSSDPNNPVNGTDPIDTIIKTTPENVFPKGFSPNGDGVNDVWYLPGIELIPDNTVTIFNRYGKIVWEDHGYDNINTVFTGSANASGVNSSASLPDGTYFYVVTYGSPRQVIKGFIVIRR